MEDNKPNPQDTSETVEPTSTEIEQGSTSTEASESLDATVNKNTETTDDTQRFIPKKGIGQRVQNSQWHQYIYMLLFILVLLLLRLLDLQAIPVIKRPKISLLLTARAKPARLRKTWLLVTK
ncbi:MAG: hypothetical protein R3B12_04365 [Candidatus Saccharimonadales bacterium]